MKALLLKEFYMAKSTMRVFVAMVLIFLVTSIWANGNMFLIMYPMIITSMLPMSLLSYDEKFHWDRYCAAMPFTRSQVVSAKYVFVLLSGLAILLISAVAQGIRLLPEGKDEYFTIMSSLLAMGLTGPAILLPIIYKLGSERARIAYYIVTGAVCALAFILPYDDINAAGAAPVAVPAPLLICLISALLFAASWLLSIQFYKKRSL